MAALAGDPSPGLSGEIVRQAVRIASTIGSKGTTASAVAWPTARPRPRRGRRPQSGRRARTPTPASRPATRDDSGRRAHCPRPGAARRADRRARRSRLRRPAAPVPAGARATVAVPAPVLLAKAPGGTTSAAAIAAGLDTARGGAARSGSWLRIAVCNSASSGVGSRPSCSLSTCRVRSTPARRRPAAPTGRGRPSAGEALPERVLVDRPLDFADHVGVSVAREGVEPGLEARSAAARPTARRSGAHSSSATSARAGPRHSSIAASSRTGAFGSAASMDRPAVTRSSNRSARRAGSWALSTYPGPSRRRWPGRRAPAAAGTRSSAACSPRWRAALRPRRRRRDDRRSRSTRRRWPAGRATRCRGPPSDTGSPSRSAPIGPSRWMLEAPPRQPCLPPASSE